MCNTIDVTEIVLGRCFLKDAKVSSRKMFLLTIFTIYCGKMTSKFLKSGKVRQYVTVPMATFWTPLGIATTSVSSIIPDLVLAQSAGNLANFAIIIMVSVILISDGDEASYSSITRSDL